MAIITKLPAQNIISGFKGTLDFYVHCGIPCVRKWPRSPGHDRAPEVRKHWPAFTWAAKYWAYLSPEIKLAYNQLAVSTNMTGRDLFTKSYINGTTLYLEDA